MNAVAILDVRSQRDALQMHRAPRKQGGFSWGRFPVEGGGVRYRLFRRESVSKQLHMEQRTFHPFTPRAAIARELWQMRIRLREAVDALDFKAMGVIA